MPTYGLLEPPAEVEVVEGGESHGGGDLGAPGGPHHQTDLSTLAVRHDAGTHGGQRPLARSDKVVRGGREVKPCLEKVKKLSEFVVTGFSYI